MKISKYDIEVPQEVMLADINRLTNQLWKLIPMKENEENWQMQLKTVLIEIVGLKNLFSMNEKYLILLSKLEGLLELDNIEFSIYRKTVFESISLLREIYNGR